MISSVGLCSHSSTLISGCCSRSEALGVLVCLFTLECFGSSSSSKLLNSGILCIQMWTNALHNFWMDRVDLYAVLLFLTFFYYLNFFTCATRGNQNYCWYISSHISIFHMWLVYWSWKHWNSCCFISYCHLDLKYKWAAKRVMRIIQTPWPLRN